MWYWTFEKWVSKLQEYFTPEQALEIYPYTQTGPNYDRTIIEELSPLWEQCPDAEGYYVELVLARLARLAA